MQKCFSPCGAMRQNVAHEVHFASLSACIRKAFVVCQESLLWQVALLDTSYIGFLWRYPVAGTLRLLRAHRLISLHQPYSLHYISVPSATLQVMRDAKTLAAAPSRRVNTGREDTKARRRTWEAWQGMCAACLSRWSWAKRANYSAYAETMK